MVASLKIGVAEDELDMREFYQIVIPEMGHRLLWAARNGVELIELAQQALPDLLIVDIKMPYIDGLVAVRSITRDHSLQVIAVSGHHDQETMERAEEEQLMCYLIKPIREADLRAAITVASKRFDELRSSRETKIRQSTREERARQSVLRAIRALTKTRQIDQRQALSRLRELARRERRTLREVSQTIVDGIEGISDNTEGTGEIGKQ